MSTRVDRRLALVFVGIISGCGSAQKLVGSGSIADRVEAAQEIKETVDETQAQAEACEKLRSATVAISEENAIGGAVAVNIIGNNGGLLMAERPRKPLGRLNTYLNTVGKNLAAQSDRPGLDWTFGILNTDGINAYSAPGGYVFVTKGLLLAIETEAELAGVLAHEIAHITERHALVLYGSIKANQCQTALAAEAAGEVLSSLTGFRGALESPIGYIDLNDPQYLDLLTEMTQDLVDRITTSGYAKEDEFEADIRAVALILRAGYEPSAFSAFLAKLPEEGPTHPRNADRQERLSSWEAEKQAEDDPFTPKPGDASLRTIPIKRQFRALR